MSKYRKALTIILPIMLVFVILQINGEAHAANDDVRIIIDEQAVSFDQAPKIEQGRTLVPLRVIFESLGADVTWIGETQTIIGMKNNVAVKLQLGNTTASLNGKEIELDVPAKAINGRILVPTRFISESLGCDIKWDGNTRIVNIIRESEKVVEEEVKNNDQLKEEVQEEIKENIKDQVRDEKEDEIKEKVPSLDKEGIEKEVDVEITIPNSAEITRSFPSHLWSFDLKKIINYPEDELFLIVAASGTEEYEWARGQVNVLKYDPDSKKWFKIWESPEIEAGYINMFEDISYLKTPDGVICAATYYTHGNRGGYNVLIFTILPDGKIEFKNEIRLHFGDLSFTKDKMILKGTWAFGTHELSFKNGEYTEKHFKRSEVVDEDSTKAYFKLKDNVVVPKNREITVKVGDTVSFIPQDSITRQVFDDFGGPDDPYNPILIYLDYDVPFSPCMADLIYNSNFYTFDRTGVFVFVLSPYSYNEDHAAEPTFIVTVVE